MSGMAIFAIVFGAILFGVGLPFAIIALVYRNAINTTRETYWISDGGILDLMDQQPDKLLSASQLSMLGDMSKAQARARLTKLSMFGLVKRFSSGVTPYYGLKQPLPDQQEIIRVHSSLGFEDLMRLFEETDFRITLTDLVYRTDLSAEEARKEIRRFKRDKIIQAVRDPRGKTSYILGPDYRDQSVPVEEVQPDPREAEDRLELLDLDVIEYAMQHEGKISPTELKVWKGIEHQEAVDLLEQLREKRFFDVIENDAGYPEYLLK